MAVHDVAQPELFDLRGRTVLVLGLGDSGLAMARWAARQGARLRVADTRMLDGTALPGWQELREAVPGLGMVAAPAWSDAWLDGVDLLAWSPGLSMEKGASGAFHARALARGITVVGELELFALALAGLRATDDMAQDDTVQTDGGGDRGATAGYTPRVVAITGTNGKTTTSALVAHLARAAGTTVACAGNIRPAMLEALCEALDAGRLPQVWVLELSSFQLAPGSSFAPDAAVILNVAEDHLDWHASAQTYLEAKQRIHAHAAVAVFNRADARTVPQRADPAQRRISFGTDAPTGIGDFGLVRSGGIDWLAQARRADDLGPLRTGRRIRQPEAVRVQRLMPVDALRIRGAHNHLNALAALALCAALDIPLARALHALQTYPGEPHRCQSVAIVDGIEYIDDSKGTNVAATAAALRGLGRRCRLIAGGVGKDQDFSALVEPVRAHAASVYLIGADADRIRTALAPSGVPLLDCRSLDEAVAQAGADAQAGEAVLLSPACASFDMFRDYEHRGRCFAAAVHALAGAASGAVGEVPA